MLNCCQAVNLALASIVRSCKRVTCDTAGSPARATMSPEMGVRLSDAVWLRGGPTQEVRVPDHTQCRVAAEGLISHLPTVSCWSWAYRTPTIRAFATTPMHEPGRSVDGDFRTLAQLQFTSRWVQSRTFAHPCCSLIDWCSTRSLATRRSYSHSL